MSREQINFNRFSLKSVQHFQLVHSKLRDFHNHWKMNALVCDSALDGCQKALVGLVFSPLFLIRFPDKHQRPIIIALSRVFFIANQFLFERRYFLFTNRARDQGMLVELIFPNFNWKIKQLAFVSFKLSESHDSNTSFEKKNIFPFHPNHKSSRHFSRPTLLHLLAKIPSFDCLASAFSHRSNKLLELFPSLPFRFSRFSRNVLSII